MNEYDWTVEVKEWIGRRRDSTPETTDECVSFFRLAFQNARVPQEAWFGAHGSELSLVVGGIFLAAIVSSRPYKAIWLLVDERFETNEKMECHIASSTRKSKEPLFWLHVLSLTDMGEVLMRPEIWQSYSRASAKIFDFPIVSANREVQQRKRAKQRLSDILLREEQQSEFHLPDELPPDNRYLEGAQKQIVVNAYERNRKARSACLAHYGYRCGVCGFSFEAQYGERGKDYIHVHHIKPMAEIDAEYEVDPIKDLRPICPNCHAMIHKEGPPLATEELQKLVKVTFTK